MIVYSLILITGLYSAKLTTLPTLEGCEQIAPQVEAVIKAPPVTVEAPSLVCLPEMVPGAQEPQAESPSPPAVHQGLDLGNDGI
jgi:hypothetical protein